MVQLSVNCSIRGGGHKVKLLGEIISAFSPRIDLLHRWENGPGRSRIRWSLASLGISAAQAPASLTPAKRLNFDRELCYPLHHGPSREFREPRGSLQGCESQKFWSVSNREAGPHAENDVNVPSVPEFMSPSLRGIENKTAVGRRNRVRPPSTRRYTLSSTMLIAAVQAAPEIHPYIKFWGEFGKNVAEIVAIIVGGFWTYFHYLRDGHSSIA